MMADCRTLFECAEKSVGTRIFVMVFMTEPPLVKDLEAAWQLRPDLQTVATQRRSAGQWPAKVPMAAKRTQ